MINVQLVCTVLLKWCVVTETGSGQGIGCLRTDVQFDGFESLERFSWQFKSWPVQILSFLARICDLPAGTWT